MNRIIWQLKYRLSLLSREGHIGLGLLVVSLILYLLIFIPGAAQVSQLHKETTILAAASSAPVKQKYPSTTKQLAAFYKFFPSQQSTPDWLGKIYHAARHENLALNEGKYRTKHQRNGSLVRYEMTLPVTGSYRQIQHFLATVMKNIPVVALDSVAFERSKIGNFKVNAKIKLSLYLERPS